MNIYKFLISIVFFLFTQLGLATSYVLMSDSNMLQDSDLVVTARVVDIGDAYPVTGRAATRYQLEILDVLAGDVSGKGIVVSVSGGAGAGDARLLVRGAPVFAAGEQLLLFLNEHLDGDYRVNQFLLGAFYAASGNDGSKVWLRDLDDANAVVSGRALEQQENSQTRDFELFQQWIGRVVTGETGPDYWLDLPADSFDRVTPVRENRYSLLAPARWPGFPASVDWKAHESGQSGMAGGGFTQFENALDSWTDEARSNIVYNYTGTTTETTGLSATDGVNAILFDDPNGEIGGSFSCANGGILARGGYFFFTAPTHSYNGANWLAAFEGNIVTQDGAGCFFGDTLADGEEVFAHELGHTLGFGHSQFTEALMYFSAHNDQRGASLHEDDGWAAAFFYQTASADCANNSGTVTNPIIARTYNLVNSLCTASGTISTLTGSLVTINAGANVIYRAPRVSINRIVVKQNATFVVDTP